MSYALRRDETCDTLFRVVDKQSETIRALNAEIERLRQQIETRKPKGGRPRISDEKVLRIEAELDAGYSLRQIAARQRVSHTTVARIAAKRT